VFAAIGISGLVLGLATQRPVNVASCDITPPNTYQSTPDSAVVTARNYRVRVKFLDVTYRTLKQVVFHLDNGSTFVDAGTFSPGVTIDHTFRLASNASTCSVASATFADGESWQP
jgi:hypothetical protein